MCPHPLTVLIYLPSQLSSPFPLIFVPSTHALPICHFFGLVKRFSVAVGCLKMRVRALVSLIKICEHWFPIQNTQRGERVVPIYKCCIPFKLFCKTLKTFIRESLFPPYFTGATLNHGAKCLAVCQRGKEANSSVKVWGFLAPRYLSRASCSSK